MPIHRIERHFAGDGSKETYTVTETTTLSPWDIDATFTVVGQPHPRVEGVEKVTGRARYTHDIWAFALSGVAAVLPTEGRRIAEGRLVLSGVAPIPWRAHAAERALVGAEIGEEAFARAADAALVDATPFQHNAYKLPLAMSLIRRALTTLAQV